MPRIMYNTCPYVGPITLEPVKNITDSMSILSDITENTSNSSDKRINIKLMFESELQKMNMNNLKSKCFANSITNVSKFKKQELVNRLTEEFELLWTYYSRLNLPELKNICKSNNFDISLKKKEDIINVIMSHNSNCKTSLFFGKNTLLPEVEESHFVKPARISDELASFLEKPSGSAMARTDVMRDINKYIRINNLQDKENVRKINPDTKLATLLKLNESDELTYFNILRYLSPHLKKECGDKETDAFLNQLKSIDHLETKIKSDLAKLDRELNSELKKQKNADQLKQHELEDIKCEKQVKLKLLKELEEEDRIQKEKQLKQELKKQQELEKIKQQEIEEENARLKQEEETQLKKQKELEQIKQQEIKNKKQVIPKNIKVIVWNHYIGENIIHHRCLCCKKVLISNTSFHAGHVISEKDGGTHEINNLRPICSSCNHSMGSENMIEFVKKYGLYIG